MPSFPWRPTFFGTPATEDRPFHAIVEYHRCPPNASIISCFDKKSIEIGSNKPISPCSSMSSAWYGRKSRILLQKIPQPIQPQPGGCIRGVLGQRLHHGDELDGPWLPPGAAAARKRCCIRHRSPAPAKGRRPAGRCGKQPRRPSNRHHLRGTDRPKSGYRSPPLRSGPASQGRNGPAVLLATGDRTQRRPTSSGSAKSRAVASSGHPPLFLCPHCTKKYRSCPSKRPLMRPLYVRNTSIFTGKITPGGKKHPSGWYSFSTGKFPLPRPAAPGGGPEQSPGTGPAGSGR